VHRTHARSLELETLVPLTTEFTAKSRAESDQLALQERSRRSHHIPRSRRRRNPDQL
jgi:hypothetical protein